MSDDALKPSMLLPEGSDFGDGGKTWAQKAMIYFSTSAKHGTNGDE